MQDIATLVRKAMAPEAPLVERHEAFGEIVTDFQDLAYGCAYAVLNDFYLAQDVAQEAFFMAWQRLDQLKRPEAFPGWFRRIVLTECNRVTRRKRILFMPLETGLEIPSADADPHTLAAVVAYLVHHSQEAPMASA